MCLLCDQARGQQFQASQRADGRALYGLSIAPAELLDDGSVAVTRQSIATDSVLDYYLHTPGGAVTVSGGGFGEQIIQSVSISAADQHYFNAMVRRLDSLIELDFRQVGSADAADVDLYYDTEIDIGGGGNTLGLATTSGFGGWELFINYPEVEFDEAYRRYVLIHEFGHALGLEHPFEAGDGDVLNGITDPWRSAYPEDTVMAYRNPATGVWPEFFTSNDLQALIQIWGSESSDGATDTRLLVVSGGSEVSDLTSQWLGANAGALAIQDDVSRSVQVSTSSWSDTLLVNRVARAGIGGNDIQAKQLIFDASRSPVEQDITVMASVLEGSDQAETLRGLAGWDILDARGGDDLVHGGNGRDIISGGTGADELHGDFGWNTYTDQRDAAADLIAIKSDQFLENYWYASAGNNPLGQKADIIEGLDAVDQIKILGVSTDRLSFADASVHGLSGVGIFADGILEALYTGGDLNSDQLSAMTSGDASEAILNNQFWSYRFGPEAPALT
ncbi:hypothetical protein [Synechococcus sp. A15-60]|uniref:hypothetical protein n=1 Tax=Synechococcus sp. A15-60 TaxID=1050655 RepID=UPI0016448E4D|nr:hypothetical protein [Synechococcus sp. A15-60]QNI46810.1 hypothetical protein SynA1560_00112 [Synechococcus sp. A15-60]